MKNNIHVQDIAEKNFKCCCMLGDYRSRFRKENKEKTRIVKEKEQYLKDEKEATAEKIAKVALKELGSADR